MNPFSTDVLLKQLEAQLQEEIGAQARWAALLEEQENALRLGRAPELSSLADELARAIDDSRQRAARRRALVEPLVARLGLASRKSTLRAIVERAGADGERLDRQRKELRGLAARVQRSARRCARAANVQRALLGAALETLLGPRRGAEFPGAGALLNREA